MTKQPARTTTIAALADEIDKAWSRVRNLEGDPKLAMEMFMGDQPTGFGGTKRRVKVVIRVSNHSGTKVVRGRGTVLATAYFDSEAEAIAETTRLLLATVDSGRRQETSDRIADLISTDRQLTEGAERRIADQATVKASRIVGRGKASR
jgi:hypothetical protein